MRFRCLLSVVLFLFCWTSSLADEVKSVDITSTDIAYEPLTRRIYVSVPGNAPNRQNSLAIVEPFNARVESSVFVGDNPGQIAISDKGKYVWIALGSNIRRYDIAEKKTGPLYFLGENLSAEEIHPVPSNPEGLLVVQAVGGRSPRSAGMVLIQNGVGRPAFSAPKGGRRVVNYGNTFAWGTYGNRAYSYNNEVSSFEFLVWSFTREGLELSTVQRGFVSGYGHRLRSDNGLVFVNGSQVLEPETRTTLGNFAPHSNVYVPDSSVGRMYFAFGEKGQARIVACDLSTFGQIDSIIVPNVKGSPTKLIRWGEDGLAFSTTENQLVLIRTKLVPPKLPLVDLSVQRTLLTLPLKAGLPVSYTLTVRNRSVNKARNVFLTDRLPGDVDVLDVKSSQGDITATDGIVRATIGDLMPQKTVTLRVNIQARKDITEDFKAVAIVRSLQRDTNPENNTTDTPLRTLVVPQQAPAENSLARPIPPSSPPEGKKTVPTASGPDLTGAWKSVEQDTTGAGVELQATLNGAFVVRNTGNKPAPACKVRFFLTNMVTLDDELLQENVLPALAPGKTMAVHLKARLRKGQSALGQVITAIVDPTSKVKDANRENNLVRSNPIQ